MKERLVQYANDFYNGRVVKISDQEYDELEKRIKEEDKEFIVLDHVVFDAQGIRVDRTSHFPTIDKSPDGNRTFEVLKNFGDYIAPKYDGANIIAWYRNGKVYKIASSGHNESGISQYEKLKDLVIDNIDPEITEIYYEAVVHKDKGTRSNANGLINSKYLQNKVNEQLKLMPVGCYSTNREKIVEFMHSYVHYVDEEEFGYIIENGFTKDGYPADGVVALNIDKNVAFARKIYNNGFMDSKITGFEITFSPATLTFSVVCKIVPVKLDGATLSKVKMGPFETIRSLGLGIGAEVQVIRSNKVIPHITKVYKKSNDFSTIVCPFCKHEMKVVNKDLVCTNLDCPVVNRVILRRVVNNYCDPHLSALLENAGKLTAAGVKECIEELGIKEEVEKKIRESDAETIYKLFQPPRFNWKVNKEEENKRMKEVEEFGEKYKLFRRYLTSTQVNLMDLLYNRLVYLLKSMELNYKMLEY